jgi:hypothetical protein
MTVPMALTVLITTGNKVVKITVFYDVKLNILFEFYEVDTERTSSKSVEVPEDI